MAHSQQCTCGLEGHDHDHDHQHTHDHEEQKGSFVSVSTHDQSIVGTYRFELLGSYEEGCTLLSGLLKDAGEKVTATGGIIGHIKAHMTSVEKGCVISVTDEESDLRPTYHNVCNVEGVAIVFGITTEELEDILRKVLPL